MIDPQAVGQAAQAAQGSGISDEVVLQVVRIVIAVILGAVGGAYTAGRRDSSTRHTLRGEINKSTVDAAVAFGRLEERVGQVERIVPQNHAAAFSEIRRVESAVERQFRLINSKLDALIAAGGLKLQLRRASDDDDQDPPQGS